MRDLVVHLPPYLRAFSGGAAQVRLETDASTVGEALTALFSSHPGVRDRIVTEQGELRPHVNVFAGEESIRFTGGLKTPLETTEELFVIPAVSGGRAVGDFRQRDEREARIDAAMLPTRRAPRPAH